MSETKARVYHAINRSQDNKPLTRFFDGYEAKRDKLDEIELSPMPTVSELLDYMLVRIIDRTSDRTDLSDLADAMRYASNQLELAATAVEELYAHEPNTPGNPAAFQD